MTDYFAQVWAGLKATSMLELSANISYLISVWLANRNSVHTWWTGIIGVVLFGLLFFQGQLYADVTLQLFYIVTSIYGWWVWARGGKDHQELPITRVSALQLLTCFGLGVLVTLGYGWLLHRFTNASYPFIDSIVMAGSVIAQLMLMNRKLENWLFWIIVDIVAVPLYATKGWYFTSGVYILFLLNAIWGQYTWWQLYRNQSKREAL
ncbi:nicotinamide riboside transporter PnuC [Deinococcus roseus]|uniref:Membrane protein n=1 Tax=Deinococcus roseus TaxID=392414 RepID=A0ABQ2D0V0_9DEIO|nr:nicotinamide riboside transporter PnuC [Deinococcus roseus]GGJ40280.1 membrane protein [Deinococcus roseus]